MLLGLLLAATATATSHAGLAFQDRITLNGETGFRIEIVGTAEESWVLRDPRGSDASILEFAADSKIPGCKVVASPDLISGDSGGARGEGSRFELENPSPGDWSLTLRCSHPKCKCGSTRVRLAAGRGDRSAGWDMLTLPSDDSLTWSIHVTKRAVQVERAVDARQADRYMKVWVIGGESTITLQDPAGRVAQATDSTAWSRIPACSTGVNPPLRAEENSEIPVRGGFFVVKAPLVGTWHLYVRRDVAPHYAEEKGPNAGIYAERHSLSDSTNWADERDRAWLGKGHSMSWKVVVDPPGERNTVWLHLVREGESEAK